MDKQALWYLFLLIVVEIFAWYFLKKQHVDNNESYTILFFFTFALIPWILIKMVKLEGIAVTNMYWNIATTILVILLGYFMFKEKINSLQYIELGLVVLSILLLSIGG